MSGQRFRRLSISDIRMAEDRDGDCEFVIERNCRAGTLECHFGHEALRMRQAGGENEGKQKRALKIGIRRLRPNTDTSYTDRTISLG